MAGLVSNNQSNYLLLSLQLARISTVFFSVPALKYFILWMQVLFSSQSAHRHCLSGYPVVRFGTQNNVVVFFFLGFQRTLFAAALQKSPFTSRSLQQITFISEIPQIIQLKNSGRTLYRRFVGQKQEPTKIKKITTE